MRPFLVIVAVLGLAAAGHAQRGQPAVLNGNTIEQAITLGRDSDPSPYALRASDIARDGQFFTGADIGRVYTPFMRVALASHRAAREFRNFSSTDIEPALLEPLLYVAIRRYQTPPEAIDVRMFLGRQEERPPFVGGILPAWIREAAVALGGFEDESAIEGFSWVAAFPLDAVKPGLAIVIKSRRPGQDGEHFVRSLIRRQELDSWR